MTPSNSKSSWSNPLSWYCLAILLTRHILHCIKICSNFVLNYDNHYYDDGDDNDDDGDDDVGSNKCDDSGNDNDGKNDSIMMTTFY